MPRFHNISKPYLGHRRRPASITAIQLSPTGHEPYSHPDTPVDGLNTAEVRLLRKQFDTGSTMVDAFRRVVEEYTGQAADDEKLKSSVSRVVRNAGAVYRTFSSLQYKDIKYLMGPGGYVGRICYDNSRNPINLPPYFHSQLDDFETTLTRDKEAGNRVIIAHYLTHAIKIARQQYKLNRIVCSSEVEVSGEQIPNVGHLSGTLDFVVGTIKGRGGLDESMRGHIGGIWYELDTPYLVILVAKKSTTVSQYESDAELLGQIRVLMAKNGEDTKLGILTDGYSWRIFQLNFEFDLYYKEFMVDNQETSQNLLGLLTLLVAGIKPAENNQNCAVWLEAYQ